MNSLEPFIRRELENQPGTAAAPQTPGSHIGLIAKPCRRRKNFFLRGRADLPLCRLAAQNNADRTYNIKIYFSISPLFNFFAILNFSFSFLAVSTKLHFFSSKLRFFLDISKSLYYTQYDD